MEVNVGSLLWEPSLDARHTSRMGRFLTSIEEKHGVSLQDYHDAWQWSIDDLDRFWRTIIDWFDVALVAPPESVLADPSMPGARWMPGALLNYAEQALRWRGDQLAIIGRSQTRGDVELSRDELREEVQRCAAGLRRLGVQPGDRVVGYLPNIPEAIVALLACASIGAVWSSCAAEFGARAVVERVGQIDPVVLLAVDGYRYGNRDVDRSAEIARIRQALPSLRETVVLPYLNGDLADDAYPGVTSWDELLAENAPLALEPVPFGHPLYVLYSSGTTGPPKAIVHGHGGILLEHLKMLGLHHDLGDGSVFTWYTTTGWMMWNYLVSGLLVGSTVVTFDGDPGHPDLMNLWRLASETGADVFGVSAPFLHACRREGISPGDEVELPRLRSVGSTGSPLSPEGFAWVYDHVKDDVLVSSASGGTDVCTAFLAAAPLLPVHAGEISGPCLGCDIRAFDVNGNTLIDECGELVIVQPMPSMPVGFWGDDSGERYRKAYFEDFPGVWRHGDWLEVTSRGSCIITGRSDATLNRGGVRMGTGEFYSVVEDVDGVIDSLVIHLEDHDDGRGELLLFVVLEDDRVLDDALKALITKTIREDLSPRHVPDHLHVIPAAPRTVSGKKMEIPVKRLLEGEPLERVINVAAMSNPDSLEPFIALRTSRQGVV